MSDPHSTSNVKIYDRPEKKGPNPMALVLGLLIILVLAFGAYRVMHSGSNSDATSAPTINSSGASAAKSANNNP